MDKSAFLARLHPRPAATSPPTPLPTSIGQTWAEQADAFEAALTAVAGEVVRTRDPAAVLHDLVPEGAVLCTDEPDVAPLAVTLGERARSYADGRPPPDRWADFAAGLTSCWLAVAETGSVVLAMRGGAGRAVSLLPPVHVVLVPPDRFVRTPGDVLRAIAATTDLPAAITFVTGPSRSADIELQLTVGVHGPRRLVALLVPPDASG